MSDQMCQIWSVAPHTLADIWAIWSVQIKSVEADRSDMQVCGQLSNNKKTF